MGLPLAAPYRGEARGKKVERENALGEKANPRHRRRHARDSAWQPSQRGGTQQAQNGAPKRAMNVPSMPQQNEPGQEDEPEPAAYHMQAEDRGQALANDRQRLGQRRKTRGRSERRHPICAGEKRGAGN